MKSQIHELQTINIYNVVSKKIVTTLAVVALLFSLNTNAQEQAPVQKKKKAKTEKTCSANEKKGGCCADTKLAEKKSCGSGAKSEKKGSCCAAKKS